METASLCSPHPSSAPVIALPIHRHQQGTLLEAFLGFLLEERRVYCLDAGNCFNPYPLALAARAHAIPPETVLERVFVSRAATCHQVVSVVEELLLPLSATPDHKIVLILALDALFTDEDIPLFERQYLFLRAVSGITSLRSAGIGCLVTCLIPHPGEQKLHQRWHSHLQRMLKTKLVMEASPHGTNNTNLHTLS